MRNRTIVVALVAAVVCAVVAATAAATGTPQELLRNVFLTPSGHVAKLAAGATYKASDFPLGLRVTAPDGSWFGAQFKGDSSYQHKKSTVAPFYGWVTFEQRHTQPAQGIVNLMTPYGPTPSVAATVARLRTGGHGATYEASSPVKLGGYSGVQFDGQVVGKEHAFIAFTAKTNEGAWHPDAIWMGKGEVFRIIVLGVRGKTVVVSLENANLPADQFPDFLTEADKILHTLKFPA